ncbi:MAG: hypothetical protein CMJ48_13280 [Planctomycetaceae bacterium]|nr:hypothetical protein [Planctomycetaceae bacterium]
MDRVSKLVDDTLKTCPRWVTAEIVRETIDLFERLYERELAPDEVREIIVNAGQFVDVAKLMGTK